MIHFHFSKTIIASKRNVKMLYMMFRDLFGTFPGMPRGYPDNIPVFRFFFPGCWCVVELNEVFKRLNRKKNSAK